MLAKIVQSGTEEFKQYYKLFDFLRIQLNENKLGDIERKFTITENVDDDIMTIDEHSEVDSQMPSDVSFTIKPVLQLKGGPKGSSILRFNVTKKQQKEDNKRENKKVQFKRKNDTKTDDLEIHEISPSNSPTKRKKRKLKKRMVDDDINDNDSNNNDVIIDKVTTSLIQKEQIITYEETHLEPKQLLTNRHIERLLKFTN